MLHVHQLVKQCSLQLLLLELRRHLWQCQHLLLRVQLHNLLNRRWWHVEVL